MTIKDVVEVDEFGVEAGHIFPIFVYSRNLGAYCRKRRLLLGKLCENSGLL